MNSLDNYPPKDNHIIILILLFMKILLTKKILLNYSFFLKKIIKKIFNLDFYSIF